jgi:hypothetical protein
VKRRRRTRRGGHGVRRGKRTLNLSWREVLTALDEVIAERLAHGGAVRRKITSRRSLETQFNHPVAERDAARPAGARFIVGRAARYKHHHQQQPAHQGHSTERPARAASENLSAYRNKRLRFGGNEARPLSKPGAAHERRLEAHALSAE